MKEEIMETKELKIPVKLGYSKLESAGVVDKLNVLLCNYHIHYQKLRNFHWNVVGADFFDLHEQFEKQYNEVKLNIDEVAERIRVFGQKPISTLKQYLHMAEIKEVEGDITSFEMVKIVLDDYETLLSFMIDAIEAAKEVGDVGTVDMINGFIKRIEKSHWMLTSFLKNQ